MTPPPPPQEFDQPQHARHAAGLPHYIPVYTMLPLDSVTVFNNLGDPELLRRQLDALRNAQVDGVMCDIWWGIVEAEGPKKYDWAAYKALLRCVQEAGLKMQVVLSFHMCGGNVGDGCYIPLPRWVLECAEQNEEIFFTNRSGERNPEYLSFGVDDKPVVMGRSAVEIYADFMASFRREMAEFLDAGVITEIEVGLGPAGELRYPSYPEKAGWRFPGVGEFQCYDKYLLADLAEAANAVGRPEWGLGGPHDAGEYNNHPEFTGFFRSNCGSYQSEYGRWFLTWYSSRLLRHGDAVLSAAAAVFDGCPTTLVGKVAGVHWWYNSPHHAAELTAGYYNTRDVDGYIPIAELFAEHGCALNFTCFEMRNLEQPDWAQSSPEGLVHQVLEAAWAQGLEASCENALARYDRGAFDQILHNASRSTIDSDGDRLPRRISSFTFLRLSPELLDQHNWDEFVRFVRAMHTGLDCQPDATKVTRRVMRSRELHEVTLPTDWAAHTVLHRHSGWGRQSSVLCSSASDLGGTMCSGDSDDESSSGEEVEVEESASDVEEWSSAECSAAYMEILPDVAAGLPRTRESFVWTWRQRLAADRVWRSARRVVRTAAARNCLAKLSSQQLWEYVGAAGIPVTGGLELIPHKQLVDLVSSIILQEAAQERSVAAAQAAYAGEAVLKRRNGAAAKGAGAGAEVPVVDDPQDARKEAFFDAVRDRGDLTEVGAGNLLVSLSSFFKARNADDKD